MKALRLHHAVFLIAIVCVGWSTANAQSRPQFEVASIQPLPEGTRGALFALPGPNGRLRVQTASLRDLVSWAFGVLPSQVIGGPRWAGSALFNIDAIADVAPRT